MLQALVLQPKSHIDADDIKDANLDEEFEAYSQWQTEYNSTTSGDTADDDAE